MGRKHVGEEERFDIEVGRRILRERKKQRWTQKHMAAAIDVIPAMLYGYESGKYRCPPYRLRLIANFLGITVSELIPKATR